MASVLISDSCSTCQKGGGKCMCGGCKTFFCIKHFEQHRQGLSMRFDDEIVRTHDELLDKISEVNPTSQSTTEVFNDIDRWETSTINKIHETAERVRQHLTQLITEKGAEVTKDIEKITKEIRDRREELDFDENDIEILRQKLHQIQLKLDQVIRPVGKKKIVITDDQIDWNRIIYIDIEENRFVPLRSSLTSINLTAKWRQYGVTVAGGNGKNIGTNQLWFPTSLYVDDDKTIYIADRYNHRILKWTSGASSGEVVAGGNGPGNEDHQLNEPVDVIVDKKRDRFIISDNGNRRVVCWPCRNGSRGTILISNIDCTGLSINERGVLYVVDYERNSVRRFGVNEKEGTIVAGGNGKGNNLDQLSGPSRVFVDRDHSVYVSDRDNNRVMKWEVGSKQGSVVAGGQGQGNALTQLSGPLGFILDQSGAIYIADHFNHRIVCWRKGSSVGHIIIGEHGNGNSSNQLSHPTGLSFDRDGNLYVVDYNNHRIQKFNIEYNA